MQQDQQARHRASEENRYRRMLATFILGSMGISRPTAEDLSANEEREQELAAEDPLFDADELMDPMEEYEASLGQYLALSREKLEEIAKREGVHVPFETVYRMSDAELAEVDAAERARILAEQDANLKKAIRTFDSGYNSEGAGRTGHRKGRSLPGSYTAPKGMGGVKMNDSSGAASEVRHIDPRTVEVEDPFKKKGGLPPRRRR